MTTRRKTRGSQWFVLTPEEKRTLAFVLAAFVIGVATKYIREGQTTRAPQVVLNAR